PSFPSRRSSDLKVDISSAEVPFFAAIDSNLLSIGVRAGGVPGTVVYDLAAGGVTPNAWHHLAASFLSATRAVTIYIDGTQRAQGVLAVASSGNTLPLIIGRSGAAGNYWRGKLDDVRVWNVVRSASEVAANFRGELTVVPAGLVGNWRFDEGRGTTT